MAPWMVPGGTNYSMAGHTHATPTSAIYGVTIPVTGLSTVLTEVTTL